MLDILQTYLNDAASPEFTQMIREAHEALDLFGIQDYQDDFVQVLMIDDAVDEGETTQNIHNTTYNWQVAVLKMMGIIPADDARVDHLTRLLRSIHLLEEYNDPVKIMERTTLEMPPEELLAEILTAVSDVQPEEWLVDIAEVSQMTIQKIIELASRAVSLRLSDETLIDVRNKYITEYKKFQETIALNRIKTKLLMDGYFESGMDVGYPLVVYLNLPGQELATLDPIDCAANLVSMALISTDGHEKPRETIKAHLDHYISDLDAVTKVDIAVNDILLKHEIYKSSGIKQS